MMEQSLFLYIQCFNYHIYCCQADCQVPRTHNFVKNIISPYAPESGMGWVEAWGGGGGSLLPIRGSILAYQPDKGHCDRK